MKKGLLTFAVALAAILPSAAKGNAKDPVLLNIDGRETRLSEFEYLYNKNNQQQGVQQSRDQYLDMFLIYKLKVADAISAGIDTTQSFKAEYDKYRKELAVPYLVDKDLQEKILHDAYDRLKEDVNVSHIMVSHETNREKDLANKALLDSIRTEIINGNASWDAMVLEYSIDPAVKYNGNGDMGYISGNGMYPEPFEAAAYSTPVGQISPVIDSGFGYHIVRVNARRPAKGQVLVEHILKLTQGMPEDKAAKQKEAIDSIYNVLIGGADFEDVARRESEDPGSARNGGKLDWFGTGRMVKPFEEAAFAAKDGEITKPFATSYGYHIIHKLAHKDIPSFEESRKMLENQINNDERALQPREAKIKQLRQKFAPVTDKQVYNDFLNSAKENGGYDSTLIAKYANDPRTLISFNNGNKISLGEVISTMPTIAKISDEDVNQSISAHCNDMIDSAVQEMETDLLPNENTEYRNLLNEYHDGILLFEISNNKVWEKASKDKEGLERYFILHKDDYKWNAPKFKGYIIFASSDSIQREALKFLADNKISNDTLVKTLRKNFGKDIKVEKVIAAKGENAIVDAVGFGEPKPENNGRWAYYFPYSYSILEQPQEASDVRGAVIADYQTYLENKWIEELKAKHKYKINKKVLKNVK